MRIQLLADARYHNTFSAFLESRGAQLTSERPDVLFDASFVDRDAIGHAAGTPKLIIANTLTSSATAIRSALGPGVPVIGIPAFPGYFERQSTIEYALPLGESATPASFQEFLTLIGKQGEQITDTVAGIFPRTLAMIVNEAAFAVQESVATAADIDVAMKLGTNYPKGPLAWCDEIGAEAIVAVLDALAREYGPERYRVASLLRRHAEAGHKFLS